ncbi:TlpA family protein disulfide reductase [Ramlibacter sp. XY19]|uniref:peroxiredoxin family protein n=1 Tax=Ramlibacter paludis TaxID=2908000 RepID=UPI0023DAB6CE|nr:TlpA disulfide reductase family protein [Ramlibacter paludis]MCG2592148.1 TlpA family protein disulfide reductase [Ramlibacter paludis]
MGTTRRNWIAAAASLPWAWRAAAAPAVGSKLALPDLPLIEGGQFRASQAEGLVTVVYWWASWCPFCAEMSPSIEKLWQSQRDRGLTVLGIAIDKTVEPAREYRRRKGYTFPSAWVASDTARVLPQVRKVPMLWVRGRDGRVVMAETGQLFPEDIEQIARFT